MDLLLMSYLIYKEHDPLKKDIGYGFSINVISYIQGT